MQGNDLFDKISLLGQEYLKIKEQEEKLMQEKNARIEEVKKQITDEYEEKLKNVRDSNSLQIEQIREYGNILEKYSTFDLDLIGNALAKLVSIMEGLEYVYQIAEHLIYKRVEIGNFSKPSSESINAYLIVKKDKKSDYFLDLTENDNVINRLVEAREAIILCESCDKETVLKMYEVKQQELGVLIDFSKFPYLQEFINMVIGYCYEKNLEKLDEITLEMLIEQFIKDKELVPSQIAIKELILK